MFADHAGKLVHEGLFTGKQLRFPAPFLKCHWHSEYSVAQVFKVVNFVNLPVGRYLRNRLAKNNLSG